MARQARKEFPRWRAPETYGGGFALTVRINIAARESQIAEIDNRARSAKLSRSAYMVARALGKKGTASR